MHCGECSNLKLGAEYFENMADQVVELTKEFLYNSALKYPHVTSRRCLAFEPQENHSDDVKGLVMIPNVGNLNFYLQTVLADLCCSILKEFETMVGTIVNTGSAVSSSAIQVLSFEKGDQASSPYPESPSAFQTERRNSELDLQSSANSWDLDLKSAAKVMSPQRASMALGKLMGNITEAKMKKRTLGRSKKLVSDTYLLAGKIEEALSRYMAVAEQCKLQEDYIWQASAMEGLYSALIVNEIRSLRDSERQQVIAHK
jgi:hypothetical protein